MMRKLIILAVVAGCLASLSGSTLQRLSLNDMIQKSTMIVRGTIQPGTSASNPGLADLHALSIVGHDGATRERRDN